MWHTFQQRWSPRSRWPSRVEKVFCLRPPLYYDGHVHHHRRKCATKAIQIAFISELHLFPCLKQCIQWRRLSVLNHPFLLRAWCDMLSDAALPRLVQPNVTSFSITWGLRLHAAPTLRFHSKFDTIRKYKFIETFIMLELRRKGTMGFRTLSGRALYW